MTRHTSRQAGFTLLEVLVSLVVLGFIVSGLLGGTRLALASIQAQTKISGRGQDLQPVDQLLRRLVAGIMLPHEPRQASLAGTASRLTCVTELVHAPGMPDRVDATLFVDAQHRLVLQMAPHVHAEPVAPSAAPNSQVLLQGVARVELSYLSPARTGWVAGWGGSGLPALVRIKLVFLPGDPRRWPPIIAATPEQDRPREASDG